MLSSKLSILLIIYCILLINLNELISIKLNQPYLGEDNLSLLIKFYVLVVSTLDFSSTTISLFSKKSNKLILL